MKTIALVGTFDSKGEEFIFVKREIERLGCRALTIHCGTRDPLFLPDVTSAQVLAAAKHDEGALRCRKDAVLEALMRGLEALLPRLWAEGKFDGVLSMGGSCGTALATAGMRPLPIGVPKVMVSTMAEGDISCFVGESDIVMMPSVADISGLNRLSKRIFLNAAAAVCGMVQSNTQGDASTKPAVAATMFGVTTPCVNVARAFLEARGYEVLVFHANGAGGRAMEKLIGQGLFAGVLDLTTTEWCDQLVGGIMGAGEHRSEAAGRLGIPQVVSVGAMDMVNFGDYGSVPDRFRTRRLYRHNPSITLMRTTEEENYAAGRKLCEKLNEARGLAAMLLPLGGVSALDAPGEPFEGAKEDEALFKSIRETLDQRRVRLIESEFAINDERFAILAAETLLDLMRLSERDMLNQK